MTTNATHLATSARNASAGTWERISLEPIGPHDSTDLSQVELNPADFGGQVGATYLVELLDADGAVLDSAEVIAGSTAIHLDDLAAELDVTSDTIATLAGQLADDPSLYDADSGTVTSSGADLIRAQIATGSGVQQVLDDCRDAQQDYEQAKTARPDTVRRARDMGASWQQIADAMGLGSREAARRIAGPGGGNPADTTDYLSDAPHYDAWAGTGPLATAIYEAGMVGEFQAVVNREVARLVAGGMPVVDALAAYDPEALAAQV